MWLVKGMWCDGRARALDFGGCYLLTKEALAITGITTETSSEVGSRGRVPLGDAGSFSIWYLLSWGAKKGGKDSCKTTQTASLEDFTLAGVIKYWHCGGTELCQPGLVQSWHKRQCPMVTSDKTELVVVIEKSWSWATLVLNRWTGEWQ